MKELTAYNIRDMSEDEARETFEKIRWPNGAVCPRCEGQDVYPLTGKKVRPGVYQCRDCRRQFTVTVGSVFEGTRIPLRDWLLVINKMASSKKGISAHQIHLP